MKRHDLAIFHGVIDPPQWWVDERKSPFTDRIEFCVVNPNNCVFAWNWFGRNNFGAQSAAYAYNAGIPVEQVKKVVLAAALT